MLSASSRKNWTVFLGVYFAVGGSAVIWLGVAVPSDDSIRLAISLSAYLDFLIYVIILAIRPLQQLLRAPWTAKLLRERRSLGITYAGVTTVYVTLIVYLYNTQDDLFFYPQDHPIGIGAFVLIYLMFITSFDMPRKAIGPKAWKILHRVGLVWIGYIYGVKVLFDKLPDASYLMFGVPLAIALIIRFMAWQKSRGRRGGKPVQN